MSGHDVSRAANSAPPPPREPPWSSLARCPSRAHDCSRRAGAASCQGMTSVVPQTSRRTTPARASPAATHPLPSRAHGPPLQRRPNLPATSTRIPALSDWEERAATPLPPAKHLPRASRPPQTHHSNAPSSRAQPRDLPSYVRSFVSGHDFSHTANTAPPTRASLHRRRPTTPIPRAWPIAPASAQPPSHVRSFVSRHDFSRAASSAAATRASRHRRHSPVVHPARMTAPDAPAQLRVKA